MRIILPTNGLSRHSGAVHDVTVYTEWLDERIDVDAVTFYRQVAQEIQEQRQLNFAYLKVMRSRYVTFLALVSGLLVFWGGVAVVFGSGR